MGAPMNDAAQRLTGPLHLTVDRGQSFEAMIAAGHYDWINHDITSDRFPIRDSNTARVEINIFIFDRCISSVDVVEAITGADTAHPWEPANIGHLLCFGASNPEEQRNYPIIALGSVVEVRGDRYVPYLVRHGPTRALRLSWWDSDWYRDYRFLAVRNRSSGP
jgi:hypothetical protein